MSDVVSLELSEGLYKLSGWKTDSVWSMQPKDTEEGMIRGALASSGIDIDIEEVPTVCFDMGQKVLAPVYDLGYLLRKLPERDSDDITTTVLLGRATDNKGWSIVYRELVCIEDTPEDAAAQLAIKLLRQGRIPRGEA